MPTNLTPADYLKPWSCVHDDELKLLRELHELCRPVGIGGIDVREDQVLPLVGGREFRIGAVQSVVRKLQKLGR